MIIVVDTNIFVGACMGLGASNAVIATCLQDRHTPLMGTALLAEYEDVLGRDALFAGCRLNRAERGRGRTERGLALLHKANGAD